MLFPFPKRQEVPRVVVTGAGILTAFGNGWEAQADGFRSGRTAFRPVTVFDATGQRVKVAAEADLPSELPRTQLSPREQSRLDRADRLLLHAAWDAWEQAGWEPADDLPMVFGTTSGGMNMGQAYYRHAMQTPRSQRQQATRMTYYLVQRQPLNLARALGIRGPITIIANACASGANAIGRAWEMIRNGRAQRVLTGGYDALSQMVFAGFDALQALSPTICRPFDAARDGLALGEGAAVMALETLESARRRGAEILAEIVGYGASTDAHHLTQPHPDGDAALASMRTAAEAAGVTPDQVGYINAHGTGTPLNDKAEAAAIRRWAGARAADLPVSSTKASIGHLLGAAGAVEAVVCLMVLREQWLPPMPHVEQPDEACTFPLVRRPMDAAVEMALSNSFGFGGANATLIFRRFP